MKSTEHLSSLFAECSVYFHVVVYCVTFESIYHQLQSCFGTSRNAVSLNMRVTIVKYVMDLTFVRDVLQKMLVTFVRHVHAHMRLWWKLLPLIVIYSLRFKFLSMLTLNCYHFNVCFHCALFNTILNSVYFVYLHFTAAHQGECYKESLSFSWDILELFLETRWIFRKYSKIGLS